MKRIKIRYSFFGQSTMEYALLLALVAAAIVSMQVYIKRGIQGRIKNLADEISPVPYEAGSTMSNSTIAQTGTTVYQYEDGITKSYQNETVTRIGEERNIYKKD